VLSVAALGEEARMTVAVRTDLTAAEVREQARAAAAPDQARRLLAIALVLEGASREDAARSTGMDRQTLRDWVHRFNMAGPAGLLDRKAAGRQRRLNQDQLDELVGCLGSGPTIERHGVVRWRLADLCALVERRFGVRYQERGMGQARPGAWLQPDLGPAAAPKIRSAGAGRVQKKLPELITAAVSEKALGKRIEIWFQML
jgi:transposase